MAASEGVHRVTIAFSDDAYRTLYDLATLKGKTITETLRDAIALEKMFQETQRAGGHVFVEHDGCLRELVNR